MTTDDNGMIHASDGKFAGTTNSDVPGGNENATMIDPKSAQHLDRIYQAHKKPSAEPVPSATEMLADSLRSRNDTTAGPDGSDLLPVSCKRMSNDEMNSLTNQLYSLRDAVESAQREIDFTQTARAISWLLPDVAKLKIEIAHSDDQPGSFYVYEVVAIDAHGEEIEDDETTRTAEEHVANNFSHSTRSALYDEHTHQQPSYELDLDDYCMKWT